MKTLARSYIWWPGIDRDIETLANTCSLCLVDRQTPAKSYLHVWEYPDRPWKRLHLDFLGPFNSKLYLIIVDSHTKWLEVEEVSSTSAKQTINKLRPLFARFGLPELCVTDNGPPFTSYEFSQFLQFNGVKHTLTPPYHPASNGQAENSVKVVKKRLKYAVLSKENSDLALHRFLLAYRNAVHSTTNETPAKLMFSRHLRTRLDLLKPSVNKTVTENQNKQLLNSGGTRTRLLVVGQPVLIKDYRGKDKWIEGTLAKQLGPVTYLVKLDNGIIWKRHIDQLIGINTHRVPQELIVNEKVDARPTLVLPVSTGVTVEGSAGQKSRSVVSADPSPSPPPATATSSQIATSPRVAEGEQLNSNKSGFKHRYPIRVRKPTTKFNL